MPSLFWAAGFSFSSSEAAIAVPYDDSLEFLFFGEESSMAARYWTHGYRIFAPTQAVVATITSPTAVSCSVAGCAEALRRPFV